MSLSSIGSFLVFVLVLNAVIFVHEFGHFITAKRFGVRVDEFGFGFPPRLVGIVRDANGKQRLVGPKTPKPAELGPGRTIYSLNLIPIGGFVRLGEDDALTPDSLAAAPKRVRLAVLLAGAVFNVLFAFLVFLVGFRVGWPDRVAINSVAANSPAMQAGIRAEDIVITAAGEDIHYTQQLSEVTYEHLDEPMELILQRGEQRVLVTVVPRRSPPPNEGPMGIEMRPDIVANYTWPQAAVRSAQEIGYQFQVLVELPGRIIRGEVPLAAVRPVSVVGLNDLTREAVTTAQEINQWFPVIQLVGLVSVALATTQLLPLPALDGGRILFVLIEVVRGRRIDPAREGIVHMVGMLVLLVVIAAITYQDIVNPLIPR